MALGSLSRTRTVALCGAAAAVAVKASI